MKSKMLPVLAGASLFAIASAANAAPAKLSNAQMDGVTAGATSIVVGLGTAYGTLSAGNISTAVTEVLGANAGAAAENTSIGSSLGLGGTASAMSQLQAVLTSP